jgi:hypothetical protein
MADTKTTTGQEDPVPVNEHTTQGEMINMDTYRETVPKWKRIWQHSLTQMILLSIQAFCGPAMSDAITGMPLIYLRTKTCLF